MAMMEEVTHGITTAMKSRDQGTLEKGRPLEPLEEQQVVSSVVKQRRDSIEQFTRGNRPELADREAAEIKILERFQPPPVDQGDIDAAVDAAVTSTGATSSKDFGKVMKAVMAELTGKTVDGKAVSEAVKKRLG